MADTTRHGQASFAFAPSSVDKTQCPWNKAGFSGRGPFRLWEYFHGQEGMVSRRLLWGYDQATSNVKRTAALPTLGESREEKGMRHWHECRICKECFECSCDASARLSTYCQDCLRMLRETLLVDSVLNGTLRLGSNN